MFKIWCEWDVGHEGVIFKSIEDANQWILDNKSLVQCYEEGLTGQEAIDDLTGSGLIGTQELIVYSK